MTNVFVRTRNLFLKFRKESFSDIYTTSSAHLELHKYIADLSKSHHEIKNINRILSKNKFPDKGFDKCIFKFLDNQYVGKPQIASAGQKN